MTAVAAADEGRVARCSSAVPRVARRTGWSEPGRSAEAGPVTAAGGYAAIVGMPEVSVLAAVERGADLSRLALIPNPGLSAVEVASVLMDGMDLVVLGLGGRRVTSTSARAIVARAHSNGCTLLAVGGDWEGASVRLQARITGYDGVSACGLGRIRGVRTAVRVRGRGGREVCGSRGTIRSA